MQIVWYGHAAFCIDVWGSFIIMDPYSSRCGYRAICDACQIVTISHDNPKYHSCLDDIHGIPAIVHGPSILDEPVTHRGITFEAIEVYEDDEQNGPNTMISFVAEGIKVSHMGDLGHPLNDEQLAFLEGTHVLLALAGGPPTIALPDLKSIIDHLQVPITIPMHFGTACLDFPLQPVEDIIELFPPDAVTIHNPRQYELTVTARELPTSPRLIVLPHAH